MFTVEETYLPMTLTAPDITDAEFDAFCEQFPDCRLESTAEGDLIVMPPTDPETGVHNQEIGTQLNTWSGGVDGVVPDSSAGFRLPNGARRSPDASWISFPRLDRLRCPEFVIELLSPTDRPRTVRAKMQEWIENGAELGWMIDPKARSVTIFRPGQEPEVRAGIEEIAGEGPLAGFVLDLRRIWNPRRRRGA